MPELPEVEQFRNLLLPLVSASSFLQIRAVSDNPPRTWLSPEEIDHINSANYVCTDVLRKGKQLCMVLSSPQENDIKKYLFLHMGMTGRISARNQTTVRLKNWKDQDTFPPKYTHLVLEMDSYQAAFSDPRRFGSCQLHDNLSVFDLLAPDAFNTDCMTIQTQLMPKLVNQSVGIKTILLDQKRVVSGVGNWVADEVLYQSHIHPDQTNLSQQQAAALFETLQSILQVAIDCLKSDQDYPDHWLFGYRWTKKKMGSKDAAGRSISFIQSGGRTSAVVLSVQKRYKSQGTKQTQNGRSSKANHNNNSSAVKERARRKKAPLSVTPEQQEEDSKIMATKSQKRVKRESSNSAAGASETVLLRRSPRFISP